MNGNDKTNTYDRNFSFENGIPAEEINEDALESPRHIILFNSCADIKSVWQIKEVSAVCGYRVDDSPNQNVLKVGSVYKTALLVSTV